MSDGRQHHDDTKRLEALTMHAKGFTDRKIAAILCVSRGAVQHWIRQEQLHEVLTPPPRPRTKSGSGVIAGKIYKRGLVWPSRSGGW